LRLAALALVFAVLALAGCGGDDDGAQPQGGAVSTDAGGGDGPGESPADGAGSEAPTQSRQDYIRAGDRICVEARRGLQAAGREFQDLLRDFASKQIDKSEYYRRGADLTAKFAAVARRAIDKLEALPKPTRRRAAFDRYVESTRMQARLLAEQADAQRKGDLQTVAKLNRQVARASQASRGAARRFGFKRCGNG
jgi:hypothetical protein